MGAEPFLGNVNISVDLITVQMADGTQVGIIGYIVKDRSVYSVESIAIHTAEAELLKISISLLSSCSTD